MKIVIDARGLRTSTGRYDDQLLRHLQLLDTENEYFVLLRSKDVEGWDISNPRFRAVACDVPDFSFAEQSTLLRQIKSLRPDLVHFLRPQQPWLYSGSKVTTIHDLTMLRYRNPNRSYLNFLIKRTVFAGLIKRVMKTSNTLLVPSNFVKEDLLHFARVNSQKIIVTPEGGDQLTAKSQKYVPLERTDFILSAGNPQLHKNLYRLIDAFKLLLQNYSTLQLVLVGKDDKTRAQLKKYVAKKELDRHVLFTGFVGDGQLRWLYEHCRAYIMPSLSEGFSLTGLEAMACGALVVSSNASCLPEVYGEAASYFDPYNTQSMASAIHEALSNPSLREQLVKNGKAQVGKYSWERMAKQTLEAYRLAAKDLDR